MGKQGQQPQGWLETHGTVTCPDCPLTSSGYIPSDGPDFKWLNVTILPGSHVITRVITTNTTYNHSVSTRPFCFSLLVQYSIKKTLRRCLTLYYKIGYVLDDFAQGVGYCNVF